MMNERAASIETANDAARIVEREVQRYRDELRAARAELVALRQLAEQPSRSCNTRHAGPFNLRPDSGVIELLSNGGGSSCLVGLTGPIQDETGAFINYQGLTAQIHGLQGSTWIPLRNGWAPAYSISGRTLLQYQGAAVQQFRVWVQLNRSGITPTTWATELNNLSISITNGDAGSGGVAPGGSFLLTGRTGVLPVGSDQVTVSASPERRRLHVEVVSTLAAAVGFAWNPIDASPASWVPLAVGVPRVLETTAPIWIASDPPATPTDIAIVEELA